LGTLLIAGGVLVLAWAVVVWRWEDPFTSLYTRYEQSKLDDRYRRLADLFALPPQAAAASDSALIAGAASRYRRNVGRGDPLGWIRIPSIGVDMLLVNGTDSETLKRGPGRYAGRPQDLGGYTGGAPPAYMPGEGERVYIAGHRTTYGAPFADIDRIRRGDRVVLELPYARLEYAVTGHRIVPANATWVLESRGVEQLLLQACHPRFFATQRYIVFAKPIRIRASAFRTGRDNSA
jgi:sortase A